MQTLMPAGRPASAALMCGCSCSCCSFGSSPRWPRALAQLRVVEVGEARVVELQVAAAGRGERRDLGAVGRGEVGPERLEVRVDLACDRGAAAAVVHHARRRDRQLRRARGRPPCRNVKSARWIGVHVPELAGRPASPAARSRVARRRCGSDRDAALGLDAAELRR